MKTIIHSIHFAADEKLETFIHKKLQKAEVFLKRIVETEVYLKLDHNNGMVRDKIVEIKIKLPRKTIFASAQSKHFEESFESALDSVLRQLKKYKEKLSG